MSTQHSAITTHHTLTDPGTYTFIVRSPHVALTVDLAVPHAVAEIYGVYHGTTTDIFTLHITQRHHAPHTHSTCSIRTVLNNAAVLTATNLIHIAHDADDAVATTDIHTLLLSADARATVTPQMEVTPSNVHCTHAATATPVDRTQRNYLHTRGLNDHEAIAVLSAAFTQDLEKTIARSLHATII